MGEFIEPVVFFMKAQTGSLIPAQNGPKGYLSLFFLERSPILLSQLSWLAHFALSTPKPDSHRLSTVRDETVLTVEGLRLSEFEVEGTKVHQP